METPRDWDRDRGEGDGFGGTGMEKTGGYTIDRGDRQEVGSWMREWVPGIVRTGRSHW